MTPAPNIYELHFPDWRFSWKLSDGQFSRAIYFDLLEGRAVLYHAGSLGQYPTRGRKLIDLRDLPPASAPPSCIGCWSSESPATIAHDHPECQTALLEALTDGSSVPSTAAPQPCRADCPGWIVERDDHGAQRLRSCSACWQSVAFPPDDQDWCTDLAPSLALHLAVHFPDHLDCLAA